MKPCKLVTRSQLKGYGSSSYHANIITKSLIIISKQGRANAYAINDVITSLRDYLKRPNLKTNSQKTLRIVLQKLLERLGNLVEVPFTQKTSTNLEVERLTKKLTKVISETDKSLAELKAIVATIKGK